MPSTGIENSPDSELLHAYAHGDEVAFEVIMRRYGRLVRSVCQRILGPTGDADDAFQATFVVLARRPPQLRNQAALPAWMHRVARNVALDALKKQNTRAQHERNAMAMIVDDHVYALTKEDRNAIRAEIDGALDRLSESVRNVLVACYFQEQTQAEAARALGMPEGTVAVYARRGIEKLRVLLGRRRVVVGSAALSSLLLADTMNATTLPAELVSATLASAHGTITPGVAALTAAALRALLRAKVASLLAPIGAVAIIGAMVGTTGYLALAPRHPTLTGTPAPVANTVAAANPAPAESVVQPAPPAPRPAENIVAAVNPAPAESVVPVAPPAPVAPGAVIRKFTVPKEVGKVFGLAFDGKALWVSNGRSPTLYKLDPVTGTVQGTLDTSSTVASPGELAWDGANLWILDDATNRLVAVDPVTGKSSRSLFVPPPPPEMQPPSKPTRGKCAIEFTQTSGIPDQGLTWGGGVLWAIHPAAGNVLRVDPTSGAVLSSWPIPPDVLVPANGLAYFGGGLWVVDGASGTVFKLHPSDGRVLRSFQFQGPEKKCIRSPVQGDAGGIWLVYAVSPPALYLVGSGE